MELRIIRRLEEVLAETRMQVLRRAKREGLTLLDNAAFWAAQDALLYRVLLSGIEDGAMLGTSVGTAVIGELGIGVDWALVNQDAAEWARRYAGDLIRGISRTTRSATRTAISNWIESGEPLDELSRRLTPTFGRTRAEMIASTEVTRAYAEGNERAARDSGLDIVPARRKPPAHPRCRCFASLERSKRPELEGKFVWVWNTVLDERVCAICGPLDGQEMV